MCATEWRKAIPTARREKPRKVDGVSAAACRRDGPDSGEVRDATARIDRATAFTADLDIDEQALERQIHYIVDACGPEMIVAAGVEAQEYHFLSFENREHLIRRTIEFVDGRVPVAVGISHPSFKVAIRTYLATTDLEPAGNGMQA